jgi:glycerol-3-phosphate acyltransferase PlsY
VTAAAWWAAAFAAGALPFSAWLARALAGADLREVGDGNPGAANAWKAGGWRVGLAALLLDFLKGALPVASARYAGLPAWPLAAIALAPIFGHAFSPFLGWRGGKGLAVTFGVWTGLTLAQAPLALGLCMALFYLCLSADAWAVLAGMAGLLAFLLAAQAEAPLLAVWLGNLGVLAWKHRRELRQPPRLRPLLFVRRRA